VDGFDYGLEPMDGGFSGETFLAEAAGERTVVRIYADRGLRRGPEAVDVDAAVLRLVRGLLPVPEVLELRRPDQHHGTPGVLVTSLLPGERLDLVLPTLPAELRRVVGHNLGVLLARLAGMPMLRPGLFVDAALRTRPVGVPDLVAWVAAHREDTALADWDEAEYDGLLAVADQGQEVLDRVHRVCLVHGDFNPKNLLVDPETGTVTGLLDWEFAHAGLPVTDLGNLLRFDLGPDLADAAVAAYSAGVPDAPDDPGELLDRARAADLWALVELAARRDTNPVAGRAHDLLLAIARAGDLHAEP
jgi:aminoglycoside phosphotransferase (APT) family kinase protein